MALEGWKRKMDDWLRKCNDRLSFDKILHPYAAIPELAPLTEQAVLEFEKHHKVRLPEEYRQYLLTIRNGVRGYVRGYRLQECLNPEEAQTPDFLCNPFPHTQDWNPTDQGLSEDEYFDVSHISGSLLLTHEGCTHYFRLVVTGEEAGNVWGDFRGSDEGICPCVDDQGRHLGFNDWARHNTWGLLG